MTKQKNPLPVWNPSRGKIERIFLKQSTNSIT